MPNSIYCSLYQLIILLHLYVINASLGTAPGDSPKNQVTKSVHRPRAILQNLNGNNASNNSSPNTPRFAGSHPSFASLKAGDAELPEATSEQAPATAAIKLVLAKCCI